MGGIATIKRTGWAAGSAFGTRLATVSLLAVLWCCGPPPSANPPDSLGTAGPSPLVSVGPAATPPGDLLADYDEALFARVVAAGWDDAAAMFLAATKVEVQLIDELSYRIIEHFPTGNTAEILVAVIPDQVIEPQAGPGIQVTWADSGGGFTFHLEYFVAYEDIPEEVRPAPSQGLQDPISFVGALRLGGLTGAEQEAARVKVVVVGTVRAAAEDKIAQFLEALDKKFGQRIKSAPFLEILLSAETVKDAWAMRDEYIKEMRRIDELKECAEHPTNPLTISEYQHDPAAKQRILDRVEETRSEITANTAVMYLGMLNDTAGGLTGQRWLPFVTGPLTAWATETLQQLNLELITQLSNEITACDEEWDLTMTVRHVAPEWTLDATWTGTFVWGPLPPGRDDTAPITGAGHATGTTQFSTCSGPIEGTEPAHGTFIVSFEFDFTVSGEATMQSGTRRPETFDLRISELEDSESASFPSEGCVESIVIGLVMGLVMSQPEMVFEPLVIEATDKAELSAKIRPEMTSGEGGQALVGMTLEVSIERKN